MTAALTITAVLLIGLAASVWTKRADERRGGRS
jgi:hypothetical protein